MSHWDWSCEATGLHQKLSSNRNREICVFLSSANKNHCEDFFFLYSFWLQFTLDWLMVALVRYSLFTVLSLLCIPFVSTARTQHIEKYIFNFDIFIAFLWLTLAPTLFQECAKGKEFTQLQCGYNIKVRHHWLEWDNCMRYSRFVLQ